MQPQVKKTDHKLEEVFRRLDSGNVQPHQGIFYDGQIFDAYTFINDRIREATTQQVMDLLRHTIRPEFLNRIDETIMFTLLNENQIRDIVGLQIEGVHKMLMQSGVDLRITDDAIDYIAREGYDPQFGARPLKRALQRLVLNELSKAIIAGKVDHQKPVIVELRDAELQFKN